MDRLIHHLVGDVVTYYWYNMQLKEYWFIRNSKEFIVVSAIVRAREIPDDYVWLYPEGEDIAHVGSMNHEGKVWIVYCPDTEWAQCACSIGTCKHTMKVFQLLHPDVEDGFIVKHSGTIHGVNKVTPLSQALRHPGTEEHLVQFHDNHDACMVDPPQMEEMQSGTGLHGVIVLDEDTEDPPEGTAEKPILIPDIIGEVKHQKFGTKETQGRSSNTRPAGDPQQIFTELVHTAQEHTHLQKTLIADLKSIRGKYNQMLAMESALGKREQANPLFPSGHRDIMTRS